jgi:hypothetical protein
VLALHARIGEDKRESDKNGSDQDKDKSDTPRS